MLDNNSILGKETTITREWLKWIKSWYKGENILNENEIVKDGNFLNTLIEKYSNNYITYNSELDTKCKQINDTNEMKEKIESDIREINKNVDRLNKCLENFNSKECNLSFSPSDMYKKAINKEATSQGMLINTINETNKIIYENLLLLGLISIMLYLLYNKSKISSGIIKSKLNSGTSYMKNKTVSTETLSNYLHRFGKK